MKKLIKENLKYIIIFALLMGWILLSSLTSHDFFWGYSFSFNTANGQIPYKDFNMIATPFSTLILAFFLFIFGKSIHTYAIIYSLLITGFTILLDKLYKEKGWLMLFLLWSPFCIQPVFIATSPYNILVIFLSLILIYLEKKQKSPLIIGLVLALTFFTKQNIGILLIIAEIIFSYKNKKDRMQKAIGFLGITSIFLFYFILTKSLYPFINQTFLGLFDFAKENTTYHGIFFYLSLLLIIIDIILFIKNKTIENAILLANTFLAISVYDGTHFLLTLATSTLLITNTKKISLKKINFPILLLSIESILIGVIIFQNFSKEHIYPTKIKYLNYFYHPKSVIIENKKLKEYIEEKNYKNIVIFDSNSYYYKITNEWKVNKYLDLMNEGNYGKNGSIEAINEIKQVKEEAVYFFNLKLVEEFKKQKNSQLDIKTLKWFLKNAKKIDEIGKFSIYKYQVKKEKDHSK